jgi:hypothetical protein
MTHTRRNPLGAWLAIVSAPMMLLCGCAARTPTRTAASEPARAPTGKVFPDPGAAVQALLAACRTDDLAEFVAIFGEETKPLLSADAATLQGGRAGCRRFVESAKQMTRLDPKGPDTLELVVGSDDWPFPAPLVKDGTGWRFDTAQGEREILRRRVGADELEAIDFCRVYVRAQNEHASTPRDSGVKTYAQKFVSTPGKKDGLYWPASDKRDESPLGQTIAAAGDHSTGQQPARSWWGYYFRILTAQGKAAPDGARSYIAGGSMVGGFALVAYPVAYGTTGIMTFIVDRDGRVYQKDLGEKTDEIAAAMKAYDPDATWKVVPD